MPRTVTRRRFFTVSQTGKGLILKSAYADFTLLLSKLKQFVGDFDVLDAAIGGGTETLFERVQADAIARNLEGSTRRVFTFGKRASIAAIRNDDNGVSFNILLYYAGLRVVY